MTGIPYGKQSIDEKDIQSVVEALKSDFLTTGPRVKEFEEAFAKKVNVKYAVAVSSGTAALHLACMVAGLKKGDELITSPITFAASANCALYCDATPVFVDVDDQGLLDPEQLAVAINKNTKIIIPVHYTGLPCDLAAIKRIADEHGITIIEDACHALGGSYRESTIGDCAYSDMACFSTHPVKHITTGEGGVITTNDKALYERLLKLRNHGMTKENLHRKDQGAWYYEVQQLGYNYRLTDIQSALGTSQLRKLDGFVKRRRAIAKRYEEAFKDNEQFTYLKEKPGQHNPYHLFVLLVKDKKTRRGLYEHLQEHGIHCQIHYIPVYWHPLYQELGHEEGECPQAERFYERIISIPMYPALKDEEQEEVIKKITAYFTGD